MRRERRAHPGQPPAKARGPLHRDALSPREEVPAHLVDAARLEAHRQRAIVVLGHGLVRMEEECRRIRRRLRVETQDDSTGSSWNVPNERFA